MIRGLILAVALGVAGCDGSPAALGITGPGVPPAPPPVTDDSTITNPGIPNSTGTYGPSIGPIPSDGRYFNYN